MTEEQKRLLDLVWQVAPVVAGAPAMPTAPALTFAEIQRMTTPELEAALAALRPVEQSRGPQVIYAKCSPSRSDCHSFGS